jgi:hypothetical protein
LIPIASLSLGVLAITGATILGSARSLTQMIGHQRHGSSLSLINLLRQLLLPVTMLVIYSLEFKWGIDVYHLTRLNEGACAVLASILLSLEGLAIVRAWELLGAQRNSIFAWLGALTDPDEEETPGKTSTAGKDS